MKEPLIKPVLQDQDFLLDVRSAPLDRLQLWWLGQSGYLVKWQDACLLIDPYLSDSLTKKYANTSKPHVRLTERVIAPEKLDFIQVVTSSHNHTDHLDAETLLPLLDANPNLKLVIPRANLAFASERLQRPQASLTPIQTGGEALDLGPFRLHAIPSAHETLDTDENGDHKYVGYIIEVGGKTIYHSGDACPYAGLLEHLRKWQIDLALLPINGRDPARGVAGNFTATEAVELGHQIQTRLLVPCHYEMFEFNTVSPDGFAYHARQAGLPHRMLRAGERLTLP